MKKIFFFFLVLISSGASAQTWQDTVTAIRKIFQRYQPANPGCELSISRNGQLIFSEAWGMADLEHSVPFSTVSVSEAGSVSKQFTAAAILLLQQQGKLSLDDDVRKYVPELPDYGQPIRLRYMMHHASGLRDWGSVAAIAGWPRTTKTYNNNDALDIIIHQRALNHAPNAEYIYSNSNYNLFAIIVERVSGMSLAAFTRKYIFGPVGMTHTQWRDDFRRVVPGRAMAYEKVDTGYITLMPNEYVYGNGGLLTTTEDLLKWNEYYLNGSLGDPSLLPKQLETQALSNGQPNPYGAGLFLAKRHGWDYISHSGSTAGYRAFLTSYPDLHLSLAWLSNTPEFNGIDLTQQVEDLFLPERKEADQRGETVKNPAADIHRTYAKASLSVPANPSNEERSIYTGTYYSEEAQASLAILKKDSVLVLYRAPQTSSLLTRTVTDTFITDGKAFDGDNGQIVFTREKGKVTGMKVSVSRARNVVFVKVATSAAGSGVPK